MFMGWGSLCFDRGSGGGIFGGVFYLLLMDMFLLLGQIWDYVYLQRYHSFVIFLYLNYMCGIVPAYLVIDLSFHCVVFPMSGQLCCMCVLCCMHV